MVTDCVFMLTVCVCVSLYGQLAEPAVAAGLLACLNKHAFTNADLRNDIVLLFVRAAPLCGHTFSDVRVLCVDMHAALFDRQRHCFFRCCSN